MTPIEQLKDELQRRMDERMEWMKDKKAFDLACATWNTQNGEDEAILRYLETTEDFPMPEDTVIFQKGVAEGRRLEREERKWGEEDEDIRQSIIKDIKWERANTPVTVDKDIRKYDEQINWLKSLRPQKPENTSASTMIPSCWSEEQRPVEIDEEINRWMGCEAFPEGINITPLPQAMEIVERTAKHFFELGEKTVPSPGGYWEGFKHGVRECQDKIRDVKDTMKEQKQELPTDTHWKPSEEQMKALKKVAYNLVGTGTETDIYLVQLYEQLKKLI